MDLRELLTEVESLIEPLLARKQQKVRVRPRVALPIISADSRRISQVLINLITNASKYAGSGTLIEVHACARAGQVRVTVADRGPGISPSMVGKLFEPYYRAGRTDGDGLGIGLSVVRTIVEAHGGRVGVKNRRSGGAAFWFELPQIAGLQRPADSEMTRLAKVEGGGLG
ncbi:MAG: sensor histidine kinase [Candidatus Limnocylindria bacterium]